MQGASILRRTMSDRRKQTESARRIGPYLEAFLAASAWFRNLSTVHARRVRESVRVQEFDAGAYICRKGQRSSAWLGVMSGLVKLSCISAAGKSVTFAGIPAGSWFGEGSVLKREPRRYDVIALRGSAIAFLGEESFHWLLDHSIPFNRAVIAQLNERLGQLMGAKEHAWLLPLEGRVAAALGEMFNPILYPGAELGIEISQEELGYLAGVSRQRVNRALAALRDAGIVKLAYGRVTVLDRARLIQFGT
jgi:CRP-like cAMP-binding protein